VSLGATCLILLLVFGRSITVPPTTVGGDLDAADVARFRAGDEAAFEPLCLRHEAPIFRLCSRMLGNADDALDAAQETFLRAFRSLRGFRGEATFRTWLTGIAINVCRNKLTSAATRAARHTVPLVDEDPETGETRNVDPPDLRPSPEATARGAELGRALEQALVTLAPEYREALLLREMQGLEYDELAAVLGCPVGTIKSRLNRARAALRQALEGVWP
jgi:RNA polymerase sigma-70 factor, ECF subfamily